ncbi:MAG TPA: hypothetical protein VFO60_11250 [Candidatus Dormibacteraeota bacterium]|nr:hypothetical protein [Candidatus Dormibacteraeota bacterium]
MSADVADLDTSAVVRLLALGVVVTYDDRMLAGAATLGLATASPR